MKKSFGKIAAAVVIVMLAALPVCAGNGFYGGFQIGPSFSVGNQTTIDGKSTKNPTFDTNVAVGGQVGYDFAYKQNAPAWAKYFGVALDYQYNGLNSNNTTVFGNSRSGYQHGLGFLGVVKMPMNPSPEYPAGKWFPYVAVGPTVVFTTLANQDTTNVGVIVEPGIRFMVTKRFSTDLSYRFRYAEPRFSNTDTKVQVANHMFLLRGNIHF